MDGSFFVSLLSTTGYYNVSATLLQHLVCYNIWKRERKETV